MNSEFDPAKHAQKWDDLPTIDFTAWRDGSKKRRDQLCEQIYSAATGSGFFYLIGHGVSHETIENAYLASHSFHDQTSDFKERFNINKSVHHRGWVTSTEASGFELDGMIINNYYESFDLSWEMEATDPRSSRHYCLLGPNVWPDLFRFKQQVTNYYHAVYQLGRQLMAAFEHSLALDAGTFLDHVNNPPSQLRLLRYYENDAPSDESNAGITAHSDYECFTILHTSGPGLQVMSSQDHWVEAPPFANAFLVNIGDCLEAWTGGVFKATQHRVVNLGRERHSLPFFFSVDYDTKIAPLPRFCTDATREKYPPFVSGEHLWARTIQTFPYLKEKHASGELQVEFDVAEENPFRRLSVEERLTRRPG